MIETAAAREIVEQLQQVEDRLGRLLVSGWRQARAEAADLRQEADALAEAGLTQVAARVAAVAEAGTAAEALPAIALAASACRLLRLRLLADAVPEGWAPLVPAKSRAKTSVDTVLPMARLLLDGREVWACAQPTQRRWLLLEPPFPTEEATEPAAESTAGRGFFSRLGRRISEALGEAAASPGPWIHHRLSGRLVWRARYPIGSEGDVSLCALDQPQWVTDDADTERLGIHSFQYTLNDRILVSGAPVFPMGGGFRLIELQPDDAAACVWLDPSGAEAFATAPRPTPLAIVWMEGAAIVPVALVTPGRGAIPPSLTHLLPGTPSEKLWRPS